MGFDPVIIPVVYRPDFEAHRLQVSEGLVYLDQPSDGIKDAILVGDRGMITKTQFEKIQETAEDHSQAVPDPRL